MAKIFEEFKDELNLSNINYGTCLGLLIMILGRSQDTISSIIDLSSEDMLKVLESKDFSDLNARSILRLYYLLDSILDNRFLNDQEKFLTEMLFDRVRMLATHDVRFSDDMTELFIDYYLASRHYKEDEFDDLIDKYYACESLSEIRFSIIDSLKQKELDKFERVHIEEKHE